MGIPLRQCGLEGLERLIDVAKIGMNDRSRDPAMPGGRHSVQLVQHRQRVGSFSGERLSNTQPPQTRCAAVSPRDVSTLRCGLVAGAPVREELVRSVEAQLLPELLIAYSLTEASSTVCMTSASDPIEKRHFTLGRPIEGMEVKVVGPEGEELPDGDPLLWEVMSEGRRTGPEPALQELRNRFRQEFSSLDDRFKMLVDPPQYPMAISARLDRLAIQVREEIIKSQ